MVERSQKEVWRLTPWLMVALLLVNFVLMAWSARVNSDQRVLRVWMQTLADFVQSPVTTVSSSASDYFQKIANLRSAASENDVLKTRVQELEVEVQSRQDLAQENERLKSLLQFKDEAKFPILTAKVIGRDPSVWFNDAIINRGSQDGVKLYMPVVRNGGLIGRITTVSPLTSQVTLITDERAGVGAVVGQVGTTGALGVVSGLKDAKEKNADRNLVEMRYVPGSVEVKAGDSVFTSGQDGIYPSGIKIGEIVEIKSAGSATVSQTILIKPTSDISSMQEVAVLLYEPPVRENPTTAIPNAIRDAKEKTGK